jgi:hypothetical protein
MKEEELEKKKAKSFVLFRSTHVQIGKLGSSRGSERELVPS